MRLAAFVVLWIILSLVATPIVGALLALSGHRADGQGRHRLGAAVGAWRFGRKRAVVAREEPKEPPHTSV